MQGAGSLPFATVAVEVPSGRRLREALRTGSRVWSWPGAETAIDDDDRRVEGFELIGRLARARSSRGAAGRPLQGAEDLVRDVIGASAFDGTVHILRNNQDAQTDAVEREFKSLSFLTIFYKYQKRAAEAEDKSRILSPERPHRGGQVLAAKFQTTLLDCKRCFDPMFKFPCARAIIRGVIWRSACAYARA